MDERKHNYTEPWDDGVYETGRTQPPKSHGSTVAFLLILVIILSGITGTLGILNIQMFRQLSDAPQDDTVSISFSDTDETTASGDALEPSETTKSTHTGGDVSIHITDTPQGLPNVPQEGGLSWQEIYEANLPSVVSINCRLTLGSSSGTGVILSDDGYIVTNAHVVEGAQQITVLLSDDRSFTAQLVGSDTVSDLAVLHIDTQDLTPAQFGDSGSLRVGDAVAAIGDPLGTEFRGTMTDGIISAINRDVTVEGRTMTLIQTNAALNSGNSGGPLINCYGQVIGINTMKISSFVDSAGVEGLGFAIPSTTVKDIVEQLIHNGYVSGRPTLGLSCEDLSAIYQRYYRLPDGLYINTVTEDSVADRAGISPGDVLMSIDGTATKDLDTYNAILYSHQAGDTVTAVIYRSGRQYSLELTLDEDQG